jgi:hypothetical protein
MIYEKTFISYFSVSGAKQPGLTSNLGATYVDNMESSTIEATAADTADPRAGLRAVASLRVLADALELKQVEAALRAGMNWQSIADALGVTRQATHKKYAKRVDPTIPLPRRNP